jgi:[NiFe] hydrogenase diaphorase moiety small subunit
MKPLANVTSEASDTGPSSFTLDGQAIDFAAGETILQAVIRAGQYIAHLCWHPGYPAQGACRLCTVSVDGRMASACTVQAQAGQVVQSRTDALHSLRRSLLQMLFVEGNHFCPSCEKSGNCRLQASAYEAGMTEPHFEEFYPRRRVDASHPDILLDHNRCILCGLCVQASQLFDNKDVFAMGGHGTQTNLLVNSISGLLQDSSIAVTDHAMQICPVGALMAKRQGFLTPIGQRRYDLHPISQDREDSDELRTPP